MAPEGGYQGKTWSERHAVSAPTQRLRWLAQHRRRIRIVAFVLDATLAAFFVLTAIAGDFRWWWVLLALTWANNTYLFGWALPSQVDRYDACRSRPNLGE